MELRTQLRRAAAYFAGNEALVHSDRRLSFAEAWARGTRLANALADYGLRPGDKVATLEKNSVEAVDIFLAAAIGNFVRVPLYARNRRESHAHMMQHTGCRLALVDEALLPEVVGLDTEIPDLERLIVRDGRYEAWLEQASDSDPDPAISADDYCVIRHTGGTTGQPKGVAYTHRRWLTICAGFCAVGPRADSTATVLHVGPLSHASGFMFSPYWAVGGRNIMMDAFDPDSFLDVLEREEVGYAFVAPTMLNAVVQHGNARGRVFPKLKCLLSASAPISEATLRKSCEIFGDHVLHSAYGQTEILPVAAMGPEEWFGRVEGSTPLQSVGRAMSFVDLEIRDADGRTLGVNEPGEIVARFENGQMEGFWNDPEETALRMVDGWIKTGDVGRIDANGFLYLLDRANDLIVSGGYNIYPAEIENVIADHPQVLAAVVFGIPHEKWGESPLAMVVVAPGTELTETDIIDLVSSRLGSFKKPGKVVFTTEPLPLSNVGKVLRSTLREPYWAGRESRISGA
ncbi:MAG: class I adenylate-forming enzyme family protein [Sphingomicrobium sp.]